MVLMEYGMEKTLSQQWNASPSLIAPIEKTWFYEGFFFGMVMVMLKDTMSVKISFMHYMKWIRVMLPIVFEEFKLVCTLLLFFSCHYHCQLLKGQL